MPRTKDLDRDPGRAFRLPRPLCPGTFRVMLGRARSAPIVAVWVLPFRGLEAPKVSIMYGWRARLGFIYPDSGKRDLDFTRMAPAGVSAHFTRVTFGGQGTLAEIGAMSETSRLVAAAKLLAALEPSCISWADTSGSFMFGPRGDRAQVEAIRDATGIPASTTSTAALAAFQALGAGSIAVATPYLGEVNERLAAFMESNGIRIAHMQALELHSEREISRAAPETVYRLAREAVAGVLPGAGLRTGAGRPDALFVPCTDFGDIDLIDVLERDLGVPVVMANQATMWHALRVSGIADGVPGFGRLFGLALGDGTVEPAALRTA